MGVNVELHDYVIPCNSRSDVFRIWFFFCVHLGKRNCMEKRLKRAIKMVADDPNARWFDGGDSIDAIKPKDVRFDYDGLADWIFLGPPSQIRNNLRDVVSQQIDRYCEVFDPIKNKNIGKNEGNHEEKCTKHNNQAVQDAICDKMGFKNLTDISLTRLKFARGAAMKTIKIQTHHGHGGGRTPGAEPNHLAKVQAHWDADIIVRGHSHTLFYGPPVIRLSISNSGKLPEELQEKETHIANAGCWLASYRRGESGYESRTVYPPRPFRALVAEIKPHHKDEFDRELPQIEMRGLAI